MPTGDIDELVDDLNVDETHANDSAESFPDPELEEVVEPGASSEEPAPTIMAADADLPAASAPFSPDPTTTAPPHDGGFTPAPLPRYEAPAYTPPPPTDIKFFSSQQLQEAVDNYTITPAQMNEQLHLQTRELAKREALAAFQEQARTQSIAQELNEYRAMVPGWDQPGSEANKRAIPAYAKLLQRGLPESDTTRLLALEQTFGPVGRMKDARATQARSAALRDSAQDVGRRGAPPSSRAKKDPLEILSLDEKRAYKGLIDKGLYQDWNAVRAEVRSAATQTSNPALRKKHAGLLA